MRYIFLDPSYVFSATYERDRAICEYNGVNSQM